MARNILVRIYDSFRERILKKECPDNEVKFDEARFKEWEDDLLSHDWKKRENWYDGKLIGITYSKELSDSVSELFKLLDKAKYNKNK